MHEGIEFDNNSEPFYRSVEHEVELSDNRQSTLTYFNTVIYTYGPEFSFLNHIEHTPNGSGDAVIIVSTEEQREQLLDEGFSRQWSLYPLAPDQTNISR
jgi:hypothetical protein